MLSLGEDWIVRASEGGLIQFGVNCCGRAVTAGVGGRDVCPICGTCFDLEDFLVAHGLNELPGLSRLGISHVPQLERVD